MIKYSVSLYPNPLNPTKPATVRANIQQTETLNLNNFADHIASHGGVYKSHDIAGVLTLLVDCIQEQLLAGNKVELGKLGSFHLTPKCRKGITDLKEFSAQDILALKVKWSPGDSFKDLRSRATFQPVLTIRVQDAVKKAKANGDASVTFPTKPTKPTGGTTPGGNTTTEQVTISVAASPTNGGTVSGGGTVAKGSQLTLTATANSGYTFSRWSDGNTSATRNVTASSTMTYTAQFAATQPSTGGGNGDD